MSRQPRPFGENGPGQANPDGFPASYGPYGPLVEENPGKMMWASIMEDGMVGVFFGRIADPAQPTRRTAQDAIFITREDFDLTLAYWVGWWEREKAEPLIEVYQRRYGQIAADLDGDSDGPGR
jgi:hypothetical protein